MCIPTVGAGTPELDMAWLHMIAARSQKCAYTRREEYPVPVQYVNLKVQYRTYVLVW